MFCSNCGAQNKDEAKFCVKCGESLGEIKKEERPTYIQSPRGVPQTGPLRLIGLWVVIKSFFSLPYIFIIETFSVIKNIGEEGKLFSEGSDIPFLNWIFTAGRVVITFISFIIIFVAFIFGIVAAREGVEKLISIWILGVIAAFFQIWFSALCLELLSLSVLVVNNTKKIVNLLEISDKQNPI